MWSLKWKLYHTFFGAGKGSTELGLSARSDVIGAGKFGSWCGRSLKETKSLSLGHDTIVFLKMRQFWKNFKYHSYYYDQTMKFYHFLIVQGSPPPHYLLYMSLNLILWKITIWIFKKLPKTYHLNFSSQNCNFFQKKRSRKKHFLKFFRKKRQFFGNFFDIQMSISQRVSPNPMR